MSISNLILASVGRDRNEPPGPRGYPVIGNTIDWIRDPCTFRDRCAEKYGDVVRYNILGQDMYMLNDAEYIEEVMISAAGSFTRPTTTREQLDDILGRGLILSEGDEWQRQRQLIQPMFYSDRITDYLDVITRNTRNKIDEWEDGETYDIEEEMRAVSLHILVETMFGSDIDYKERNIGETVRDIQALTHPTKQPLKLFLPDWAPIPVVRRFKAAIAHIEDLTEELIEKYERTDGTGDDLLSLLLEAEYTDGEQMSTRKIQDQMKTFLFAGHETSGLAMAYALYLLSQHPDVERKLLDEVTEVLGDREPTPADLPELEYTENVIREAMRIYPPAHEIRREAQEPVEIGGYTLDEGSVVTLPVWVLHHHERYYDDPYEFRPERWMDGLEDENPKFAYFPFGGGPRICIARRFAMMELQLLLAMVVREYELELMTEEPLDFWAGFTLIPKQTISLRVTRRDDAS